MDAAGEGAGVVFVFPRTGTVTHLIWRWGAVTTGEPAMHAALETVGDADGLPTGTLLAAGAEATIAVVTGDANTIEEIALDTPVAVTRAGLAAFTLQLPDPSTANLRMVSIDRNFTRDIPYCAHRVGGAWSKLNRNPIFALRYSDGNIYNVFGCYLISSVSGFTSVGSGQRAGMYLAPSDDFPVSGAWANMTFLSGVVTGFNWQLYSITDGAILWTSPEFNASAHWGNQGIGNFVFDQTLLLEKGKEYALRISPTGATVRLRRFEVETAEQMNGNPGGTRFLGVTNTLGILTTAFYQAGVFSPSEIDADPAFEPALPGTVPEIDEIQFPVQIARGAVGGPVFRTNVIATAAGTEQRIAFWDAPRRQWDVSQGLQSRDAGDILIAFFMARQGRLRGFRFKDWSDYRIVEAENMTLISGTDDQFQIVKRYASGSVTTVRNVYKPVEGTVMIYDAGDVEIVSGFSVDHTTGIVTFTEAPGFVPRVTCEFDVPARFDTDEMRMQQTDVNIRDWGPIPVVEVRT